MRESRRNEVAAGVFVVAMGAALLVWLSLLGTGGGRKDSYAIVYENVLGIEPGVEILYEGYPVGIVDGITPIDRDGRRAFEVGLSIEAGWPIPEDSVATISAPGLLSAVVIDIRAGDSPNLLEPGSEIAGHGATDVLTAVNAVAEETLGILQTTIRPLLEGLAEGGPLLLEDLSTITASLDGAAAQLQTLLDPENVDRLGRILRNVDGASEQMAVLMVDLSKTRAEIDGLLVETRELVGPASGGLGAATEDLEHSLAAVARHIDAITSNLEDTTRNLKELTQDVREDPGLLLRGRETGEVAP